MRHTKWVLLMASVIVALSAASAQASNCHGFVCLNREVNGLQRQVKVLKARQQIDMHSIGTFYSCLLEVPITDYGDPFGSFGYQYDDGSGVASNTTGLDVTNSGDTVGAWAMTDQCNTTVTAAFRVAHATRRAVPAFGPIAPMATASTSGLFTPQHK